MIKLLLISCVFLLPSLAEVFGERHRILWNAQIEPRLKYGLKMEVKVNDWMDILCPQITDVRSSSIVRASFYIEVFNVTAQHYKHCAVAGQRRLLHCKDPQKEIKLTTKFQTRSPSPIGFVFRPGQTYYYLSKPLHKRTPGCTDDTLRMEIKVKEKIDFEAKPFQQLPKSRDSSHFHYHHHSKSQLNKKTLSNIALTKARKIGQVASSNETKTPRNAAVATLFCQKFNILNVLLCVVSSYLILDTRR